MNKQDILRAEITAKLVAVLEKGVTPWRQPWFSVHGSPKNALNKRPYTGCNVWLLGLHQMAFNFDLPMYATFNQWADKGCRVKARPSHIPSGQWGSPIVFYNTVTKKEQTEDGDKTVKFPVMKSWTVFNVAQVEGEYADSLRAAVVPKGGAEVHAVAEQIVVKSGAKIVHGGDRACFHPETDYISMPSRERFTSTESYYNTAFHELCHWTGHHSRLNRCPKFAKFGTEGYALEELVAELGGVYTCAAAGLPLAELENHASYLDSWLTCLKQDSRIIFTASSAAQAAADYLLKAAGLLEPAVHTA